MDDRKLSGPPLEDLRNAALKVLALYHSFDIAPHYDADPMLIDEAFENLQSVLNGEA